MHRKFPHQATLFELKPVFLKDVWVFICSLHVTENPLGTQVLSYITGLPSLKPKQQICSLKWCGIYSWHLTSTYSAE